MLSKNSNAVLRLEMNGLNPTLFVKKLYSWHTTIERRLPWKDSLDPYKIWLSEIIMQQTRVQQGESYYLHFIERYPTVNHLAQATEDMVMRSWQGLGYYSRARNLHHTAKKIVHEYGGIFPCDFETLLQLPGIGKYTAAAIASFAFQKPYAVVDGNVIRVLARVLGIELPYDISEGRKYIEAQAQIYLDKNNPSEYNQAIMDFGALQCKPQNPDCKDCVLKKDCIANLQQKQGLLPVKSKSTKVQNRFIYFAVLINFKRRKIFLRKRIAKDIWQGLYEFPALYQFTKITKKEKIDFLNRKNLLEAKPVKALSYKRTHKLSHQELYLEWEVYETEETSFQNYQVFGFDEIKNLALPKPLSDFWMEIEKSID